MSFPEPPLKDHTAVISDIHGNSPALETVLADVDRNGCVRLYCLGDIINGPDPHGCVNLLRAWGQRPGNTLYAIQGNAEAYILTPNLAGLPHPLPRITEAENQELMDLVTWFRDQLSAVDLDWLTGLPEALRLDGDILVHDSPIDRFFPARWHIPGVAEQYQAWFYHAAGLSPDLDGLILVELLDWMESARVTRVFCGHTHVPFLRQIGARLICNAGSVGYPLDGDPRSSWVLLDGEASIRRVAYGIDRTLRLIDNSDDPSLADPGKRRAQKRMIQTGVHWRA